MISKENKIKSIIDESFSLINENKYSESVKLLEPILDKLKKSNNETNLLLRAMQYLGICYFELENLSLSKGCFNEGLSIAIRTNNQDYISRFKHELSLIAFRENRLEYSLKLISEAIKIAVENVLEHDEMFLHLSVLLQVTGQYTKALSFLEIVKANCEREFDIKLLSKILNELGIAYFEVNRFNQGVLSFAKSIQLKKLLNDDDGIKRTTLNLSKYLYLNNGIVSDPEIKNILSKLNL